MEVYIKHDSINQEKDTAKKQNVESTVDEKAIAEMHEVDSTDDDAYAEDDTYSERLRNYPGSDWEEVFNSSQGSTDAEDGDILPPHSGISRQRKPIRRAIHRKNESAKRKSQETTSAAEYEVDEKQKVETITAKNEVESTKAEKEVAEKQNVESIVDEKATAEKHKYSGSDWEALVEEHKYDGESDTFSERLRNYSGSDWESVFLSSPDSLDPGDEDFRPFPSIYMEDSEEDDEEVSSMALALHEKEQLEADIDSAVATDERRRKKNEDREKEKKQQLLM